MKAISYTTPDVDGYIPDPRLIGSTWRHSGNREVYTITGFVFFGDEDRWAVTHQRLGVNVTFSRTVRNFFGARNGEPRYTKGEGP